MCVNTCVCGRALTSSGRMRPRRIASETTLRSLSQPSSDAHYFRPGLSEVLRSLPALAVSGYVSTAVHTAVFVTVYRIFRTTTEQVQA